MASCIADFPEELLDRILSLYLSSPPLVRPEWHTPSTPASHLSPLLVSRNFYRIGTPYVYNKIYINRPSKALSLLRSLQTNPSLAQHIKSLTIDGIWPGAGDILSLCGESLRFLDFNFYYTIPTCKTGSGEVPAADKVVCKDANQSFCDGLMHLSGLRHLIVRKDGGIYARDDKLRAVVLAMANALEETWEHLEIANIAYKFGDDSISPVLVSTPNNPAFVFPPALAAGNTATANSGNGLASARTAPPVNLSPEKRLALALARCPHLHTFCTLPPTMWNTSILCVSQNPNLQRIVLGDLSVLLTGVSLAGAAYQRNVSPFTNGFGKEASECHPGDSGLASGLFMSQAKAHPRLMELIKAGRPVYRSRSHTLGTIRTESMLSSTASHQSALPVRPVLPPSGPSLGGSSSSMSSATTPVVRPYGRRLTRN